MDTMKVKAMAHEKIARLGLSIEERTLDLIIDESIKFLDFFGNEIKNIDSTLEAMAFANRLIHSGGIAGLVHTVRKKSDNHVVKHVGKTAKGAS